MRIHYLKIMFTVAAAVLLSGIPAMAAVSTDVKYVSGEITWVDTRLGKLQIESDTLPATGEIAEYRISEHETRVTELSDRKFLSVGDLWPGQQVTLDVINGQEEKIVQKITITRKITDDLQEAYGEIQDIDVAAGSLVLTARSRVGDSSEVDLFHFYFKPDEIVAMRSPGRQSVQLEVKPGDLVKVGFVVRDGKRWARTVTLYPPRAMSSTTTTTTVTTTQ